MLRFFDINIWGQKSKYQQMLIPIIANHDTSFSIRESIQAHPK